MSVCSGKCQIKKPSPKDFHYGLHEYLGQYLLEKIDLIESTFLVGKNLLVTGVYMYIE